MAFGFFRKKNYADSIFINAKLVTEDEELKNCSWVAVKDERIQAIGEGDLYGSLKGKDTEVYDLGGRFLAPGLIDAFSGLASDITEGSFIEVSPDADEDEILKTVSDFAAANADAPFCLVCGAAMKLFSPAAQEKADDENDAENEGENEEENVDANEGENVDGNEGGKQKSFIDKLDEASSGIPTVIMFEDGMSLRLNSPASDAVTQRADEMAVRTITPEFALDAVISTDYLAQAKVLTKCEMDYASAGYTAIFTAARSSYFDKLCRDLLIDAASCGMIKQRTFEAYPLRRMFNPASVFYSMNKAKTDCTELNGKLNYVTLSVISSSDESSVNYMTEKYLEQLCSEAADKGYNIRVKALDKNALITAVGVLGNLSSIYKKLSFAVIHNEELSEEERSALFFGEIIELDNGEETRPAGNEGIFRSLTIDAAKLCGADSVLGSIEEGKLADLAVFDEDPLAAPVGSAEAYMTVVSGVPVYTRGKDDLEDWIFAINEHLGSVAEYYEDAEDNEEAEV